MRRPGFSLLEIVIYVGLLAGTLAALTSLFTAGMETQTLVAAQTRIAEAQRVVELTIQERLAEASTVTAPATGSSSTLTVASPTPAESPVTFAWSEPILTMQLGSGLPQALTPPDVRVTSFTATRLNGTPASVRVTASFASDAPRATLTATSTFTVTLPYE